MKTVVISGGNRGIGLETVKKFSKHGYRVFLGARNYEKGVNIGEELSLSGFLNIIPIELDITNQRSIDDAKRVIQQHTSVVDALINNAGIRGRQPQQPSTVDLETIRSIFETNFFGSIRLTQSMLPLLRKSGEPRIVNVSSELASLTLHDNEDWKFYTFKDAGYGPSKTALNAFTVMLAYELRDSRFRVNAVDPGYTATEFNNYKGTGHVSEAADLVFEYATLRKTGPTGQFLSSEGELPW